MKVLELFAGIGGCAFALGDRARVVAAVDQDEAAANAYRHLHGQPVIRYNLHHAKSAWFGAFEADLWWMSPPCQPYTVRGHRRDLDDRRSLALQRVASAIGVHRPFAIALENVPPFAGSRSEALIREVLERCGYHVHAQLLCPTELGVRAERRRYYLVACQQGLLDAPMLPRVQAGLQDWIAPFDEAYEVPEALALKYEGALHTVDADDPQAVLACFTGAYGRSPVYAGSYLVQDGRLRWFTPVEIARSLGFPHEVCLPGGLTRDKSYKLVGNSLAIASVRYMLARIPGLERLGG